MIKKLNSFINSSICISIMFIIIGIIMVIMPKMSLEILGVILSVILIINGVILMITDIKLNNNFIPVDILPASILSILLGIMMLIYPNILSIIIPLMLGTWFIMTSIFKIRLTLYLSKIQNTPWILLMLISILSIVCGFILILNPIDSSVAITLFIGIVIIVYAISDIINMIVLKRNIKNIAKYFKENIKIIEE